MEIESKNGSKIKLPEGSQTIDFGRGLGFDSTDLTVSRRHVSFKLHEDQTRVYFEVKGKNPIWVHDSRNNEIRVYGRSERGEMKSGDSFCVSSKHPVWFNLKKIAFEDEDMNQLTSKLNEFAETSGIDYVEIETGDISHIDPVKEFNFVVMGHEFDSCPKNMIRDIKNWDWFLEEAKEDSDDDESSDTKRKKGIRRKRKKGGGDEEDDDIWTGESEEDAEMIKNLKKIPKPKYSTRSKDRDKNKKGMIASKSNVDTKKKHAKNEEEEEEEEEEDDDDDTLGGFVVEDEEIGEGNDEDDEEFEEDEDDEE